MTLDGRAEIPRPAFWTPQLCWFLAASGAVLLSLLATGLFRQALFNPGGIPQLWNFLQASLQPDLSPEFLQLTGRATLTTLAYACCGTLLSVLAGLVGGVLTAEVWWQSVWPQQQAKVHILINGTRALLVIPRAIHELIWGLFFVNIFGLDPLVAILGIAIPYGAIVAKVFAEILDETPRQPLQALLNSGVLPFTAFCYTLLPQAFLDLLSYTFYRFECSIRSATVLGIIGAGGLGYEILLSLQSLRYSQLWTLFYALFLLNGFVDAMSALLRHRLGSPTRLDLNLKRRGTHAPISTSAVPAIRGSVPLWIRLQRWLWIHSLRIAQLGLLVLIPFSFWYVQADFSKLVAPRTVRLLGEVTQAALPPRLNGSPDQLVTLSLQTLAMSVLAIAIAGLGGMLLSFPAAHNFFLPGGILSGQREPQMRRVAAWLGFGLTRSVLLICRAIPAPIWALVALFVLFPGILPGAIALGIHNLGILGRLMAEVTENLDRRPLLALKAQGSPGVLIWLYGVLPLTLTRFLAYILYRWEVCMRETVIVGLVGAGGLGRLLTEQLSGFDYAGVLVTLGCLMLLTLGVDSISRRARQALR